MIVEKTKLEGCFLISPSVHQDERGLFIESFNKKNFETAIADQIHFVQDNHSVSKKNVLRGLHYQEGMHSQAKLVRVVQGSVLDVCVDIRPDSKTFGKHFSIVLNSTEHKQLFIPRGFAHGFLTLEDNTIFNYKCDNYYNQESERGIRFDDSTLNIDWGILSSQVIVSDKDKRLPEFNSIFK